MQNKRRLSLLPLCGLILALFGFTATGCKIEKVDTASNDGGTKAADSTAIEIKRADGDNVKVGFVTNCQASFWVIAQAGCEAAAKENGVECVFRAQTSGSKAEDLEEHYR